MKNILQKVGVGIVTGTLFLSVLTPATFAHTISITNNGSGSKNVVHVSGNSNNNLSQTNMLSISNDIAVSANTGGNRANNNTGGPVSIVTGDATTDVSIMNHGNMNLATIQACQNMGTMMSMQGMMNMPMDQMMQMCMMMDMCKNMSMEDMMAMCQKMGMNM